MQKHFLLGLDKSPHFSLQVGISILRHFAYYISMLIPANNLDLESQAECQRNVWIALDPKTGAYLRRSTEEFKPGKQVKYYLSIPNVMVRVIWAKTDEEAMAIANNGQM